MGVVAGASLTCDRGLQARVVLAGRATDVGAPVRGQRTSVGLDVHARSVVGCGLDGETGELFERRLTPAHGGVLSWVRSLPGPVAVTYEAGPTGFGLARFLVAAGVDCQVAAPPGTFPIWWTPDEVAAVPEHMRLIDGFDPEKLH